MTKRLKGRVSLITGAAFGIGRTSALAFAREGAKIVIADVNESGGEETAQLVRKAGGEAMFIRTDVSCITEVEAMIAAVIQKYGRLDYAHNNAGIEGSALLTGDYDEEEWDRVIAVNQKGIWLCMKYEIRQMLEQKGGAIVNTSSGAGIKGFPYHAAYSASKHAIIGLTRTAALEYAKKGIRINTVCPGFIRVGLTEQAIAGNASLESKFKTHIPMGRFGEGDEVAEAVVWLCSDAASFVTGQTLAIDGGASA
jgi:NAD(P)-dependent dehydrogenase (short-subunit alcohol dehydrogenase family)